MNARIYDGTVCELGEGPLWHPLRHTLFWFDILGKRLYERAGGQISHWQFDQCVSAAGWVDAATLLVASQTALIKLDLETSDQERVTALEADNLVTRSNDGRADKWGGFWIGTMGLNAEPEAGAIYRFYRGELRQLHAPITIPNAICFSPGSRFAYFTDTPQSIIWRQALDPGDGWPASKPEVFLDLSKDGLNPDGAVVDAMGFLWNAQWGAARLARYTPDGHLDLTIRMPAARVTCPAFGDDDLKTIFVTSATQGMPARQHASQPEAGKTFAVRVEIAGQREHQVLL